MNNKGVITILIFLSIIMIGVITGGGYFLYKKIDIMENSKIASNSATGVIKKEIATEVIDGELGFIKESEDIIVNLSSSKSKKNYLKIKINFELNKSGSESMFDTYNAIIFDKILTVCSSKTKEELMSIGGKEDLKEELRTTINLHLPAPIIKRIYFRIFVIQ
jgi:flagellar FliL protein